MIETCKEKDAENPTVPLPESLIAEPNLYKSLQDNMEILQPHLIGKNRCIYSVYLKNLANSVSKTFQTIPDEEALRLPFSDSALFSNQKDQLEKKLVKALCLSLDTQYDYKHLKKMIV